MPESKRYHYWKDGNEYEVVVYEGDEGWRNGYGHGIRTETTIKYWHGGEKVVQEDIYGDPVYIKSTTGIHDTIEGPAPQKLTATQAETMPAV